MRKLNYEGPLNSAFRAQATMLDKAHAKRLRKVRNYQILTVLAFIGGLTASWLGDHIAGLAILCLTILPLYMAAKVKSEIDLKRVK